MTTVYVIHQEGIYRQNCLAVFSTLDLAIARAEALAENDVDNYHYYSVFSYEIDSVEFPERGRNDWDKNDYKETGILMKAVCQKGKENNIMNKPTTPSKQPTKQPEIIGASHLERTLIVIEVILLTLFFTLVTVLSPEGCLILCN